MITRKMKIVLSILSLTTLINVTSSQAVVREAFSFAFSLLRAAKSRPSLFVGGVLAYPWLHKHFFVTPEAKRKLLSEKTEMNKKDRLHNLIDNAIQTARNIRDNSREIYQTKFDKQRLLDRYNKCLGRSKDRWNKIKKFMDNSRMHSDKTKQRNYPAPTFFDE